MLPSDAAPPELELTHLSPGLLMGSLGPLCLALWVGKPTPELFEVQRAGLAVAVAKRRGEALFLCVITSTADPPDETERKESARMITSHGGDLAACACVIEGTGFRAAVTRTVLGGISLLVRSPVKLRYFDSVANACDWLETIARPGEISGLSSQIELARARVEALPR
jgi:hypothetical protein